jgi:uncharacterized protein YqhQ
MKKIMTLMLGLSLALGSVAVAFAQEKKKDDPKKDTKKKKSKKKTEGEKKGGL